MGLTSRATLLLICSGTLASLARAAVCPHEDGSFDNWSSPATWDDGKVPIDEQVVTITKPILLDTATARLGGVEIRDGGRLVFSPSAAASQPVALTARHVMIGDGGRMDIG